MAAKAKGRCGATPVFSLEFAPRRACAACAGRDDGGAVVNFVWIRIAAFPPSIVSARGGQCTASSGFHGEHSCLLSHSHVSLAICGGHLAMNRRHPNHLQRAALLPACAEPYLQPPATTPSPPHCTRACTCRIKHVFPACNRLLSSYCSPSYWLADVPFSSVFRFSTPKVDICW